MGKEFSVSECGTDDLLGDAMDSSPHGDKGSRIPSNWDVLPMNKMTNLMTNGFVGTAKIHYTDSDQGVLYIQGYNIEENSFNFNGIKRVTTEFHKRNSKSSLRTGDLLTVQTGDVGLTSLVPDNLAGSNCHALIISRFEIDRYDPRYFAYYMNSPQGRARLKDLEVGTTMKHINVGDLLCFGIPHPKLKEEQTAIANTLSDVDALLNSLEKLIAKKQAIKTAAMQELLTGRVRLTNGGLRMENGELKGSSHSQFSTAKSQFKKGYKQSELGEIPEDWEVLTLGELLTKIIGGGTPSRSNPTYWGGNIPWVTVKDFATFNPVSSQEYITEFGLKNSASNLIPRSTLITSTRMALGKAVMYDVDVAINQDLKALFPSGKLNKEFLYFWFEQNAEKLDELGSGSTVKGLSLSDLRNMVLALPPMREQASIAAFLSDVDNEVQRLHQRLNKTQQIKQGMMQELLTGRIRLVNG